MLRARGMRQPHGGGAVLIAVGFATVAYEQEGIVPVTTGTRASGWASGAAERLWRHAAPLRLESGSVDPNRCVYVWMTVCLHRRRRAGAFAAGKVDDRLNRRLKQHCGLGRCKYS